MAWSRVPSTVSPKPDHPYQDRERDQQRGYQYRVTDDGLPFDGRHHGWQSYRCGQPGQ
jgi:hypothetical protein